MPVVLNAANEIAVSCFLKGALPFSAISSVVSRTLASHIKHRADTLEAILDTHLRAQEKALSIINKISVDKSDIQAYGKDNIS